MVFVAAVKVGVEVPYAVEAACLAVSVLVIGHFARLGQVVDDNVCPQRVAVFVLFGKQTSIFVWHSIEKCVLGYTLLRDLIAE